MTLKWHAADAHRVEDTRKRAKGGKGKTSLGWSFSSPETGAHKGK